MEEKLLRQKRGVIASVNDISKTVCDLDHTRHWSPINTLVNLFTGLFTYSFLDRLLQFFYG